MVKHTKFLNQDCVGIVIDNGNGEYLVKGKLRHLNSSKVLFIAANSPDFITSYSGSGLPFPNANIAFENTPNRGVCKVDGVGNFQFHIRYPNSYYQKLGTELIDPHVFIKLCNDTKIHSIKLGNTPSNINLGPTVEKVINNKEIKTQEKILLENGI